MFRRLRICALVALGLLAGLAPARAVLITVPMTAQIDIGLGPVIGSDTQLQNHWVTFENEGGVGFTRMHLVAGNGMNSYYGGPIVYLSRLGYGPLDLSQPTAEFQVDVRYWRDPNGYTPGRLPDAPIGMILFSAGGQRRIMWPYQVYTGDPLYPTWTHLTVDPNTASPPNVVIQDVGNFDNTQVTSLMFYGTNWGGQGNDFIDVKQLVFRAGNATPVPEPSSLVMACLGSILGLAAVRRRGRNGRS